MVCAFLAGNISGVAPGATVSVAAVPGTSVLESQAQIILALDWLLSLGQDIITTAISTGVPGDVPAAIVGPGPSLETSNTPSSKRERCTSPGHRRHWQLRSSRELSTSRLVGSGAQRRSGGRWAALFGSAWGRVAAGVHKPDIVAPGYLLHMPKPGGGYYTVGGTSFAASIVAGAAALVLEKHPTLRGNPAALAAKLATLVRPVKGRTPKNSTGAGLLDLSSL